MANDLGQKLDFARLAELRVRLSGRLIDADLGKATAELLGLSEPTGEVKYWLNFEPVKWQRVKVVGCLDGDIGAICQRCLQPMQVPIRADVRLVWPAGADDAVADYEPLAVDECPKLGDLLQEQIVLALPLVARHDDQVCEQPAGGISNDPVKGKWQPFANLADWMQSD